LPRKGRGLGNYIDAHASNLNQTIFPGRDKGYDTNINPVHKNNAYIGSVSPIPGLRSNF
jgi:hypothetical protein|tara:strand:+ start:823 stop:999 length:177 start_codon:yes stop_codon:yes gene_type:complete